VQEIFQDSNLVAFAIRSRSCGRAAIRAPFAKRSPI
jgi:hypothetical protein